MANQVTAMMKAGKQETVRAKKVMMHKLLNADALLATMQPGFEKVKDNRPGKVKHTLVDTLMAGFAIFSLTIRPCLLLMNGDLLNITFRALFKDAFRPL